MRTDAVGSSRTGRRLWPWTPWYAATLAEIENGLCEIETGRQRIGPTWFVSWHVNCERNTEASLEVHDPFEDEAVIAHHVAVIAGEDHDRVVGEVESIECGQNLPTPSSTNSIIPYVAASAARACSGVGPHGRTKS